MLDRQHARRWTHASQGALALLLVAGALASTRDLNVVAPTPEAPPPTTQDSDQGYQAPQAPTVDVAIVSEGLSRPAPPAAEIPDVPIDETPIDPDPGDVAAGSSDELRYLGSVVGGGKRMALVALGDRQKLVSEGRDFEGLEIVSVGADRLVVRDDAGEREVAKSRRSGSRFTEVSIKGGGDESALGARELSRRGGGGGVREDMRRRIEDLQRAAIRDGAAARDNEALEALVLDEEAQAALEKAKLEHDAAEARRAANAKRKPAARPTPGEQGP